MVGVSRVIVDRGLNQIKVYLFTILLWRGMRRDKLSYKNNNNHSLIYNIAWLCLRAASFNILDTRWQLHSAHLTTLCALQGPGRRWRTTLKFLVLVVQ